MKYPRTPIDDENEYIDYEDLEALNEDDLIERERDLKEGYTDSVINSALEDNEADDLKNVL